ncbi:MAG: hypothetical protein ACTSRU_12955 [Candidatus Hodarchaeales archaeon]
MESKDEKKDRIHNFLKERSLINEAPAEIILMRCPDCRRWSLDVFPCYCGFCADDLKSVDKVIYIFQEGEVSW